MNYLIIYIAFAHFDLDSSGLAINSFTQVSTGKPAVLTTEVQNAA